MKSRILTAIYPPELSERCARWISGSDVSVYRTDGGREFLEMMQERRYHLLLISDVLSGIDGYGLIRKLAERQLFHPVVMLGTVRGTPLSNTRVEERYFRYIAKPFRAPEIHRLIRQALKSNHKGYSDRNQTVETADNECLRVDSHAHHSDVLAREAGIEIDLEREEVRFNDKLESVVKGRAILPPKGTTGAFVKSGTGPQAIDRATETRMKNLLSDLGLS